MIVGAVLIVSWFLLLLRHPGKALPISAAALFGLAMVGLWVVWMDNREAMQLARLEVRLGYDEPACPADRPLRVTLKNTNEVPLQTLHFRVAAYAPGNTVNLAEDVYSGPRYQGPGDLQAGAQWKDCLPLPAIRAGYRPQTLEFRAEYLQGSFSR